MHAPDTPAAPRAQAADAQYTDAHGHPVEIKRYPTRLSVRCPACGHEATVALMLDAVPKLKCSRCGCADPIIGDREPLRSWARKRRKQNCG